MLGLIRRYLDEMASLTGIDLMVASNFVDKVIIYRRRPGPHGTATEGNDRHGDRSGQRGPTARAWTRTARSPGEMLRAGNARQIRERPRKRPPNLVARPIELLGAGGTEYRSRIAEHLHRLAAALIRGDQRLNLPHRYGVEFAIDIRH